MKSTQCDRGIRSDGKSCDWILLNNNIKKKNVMDNEQNSKGLWVCGLILIAWTTHTKIWMKKYKWMINRWEEFEWKKKKMWAEVDFLFYFVRLCRFFSAADKNGLHNSSKNIELIIKNVCFIVKSKVTLQMQYWITVDYFVFYLCVRFSVCKRTIFHLFKSQSNADVSSML